MTAEKLFFSLPKKISSYESETIVSFNDSDDFAEVWTFQRTVIRRMLKLMESHPNEVKATLKAGQQALFIVPRSWIAIRPPRKCTLTDEQKNANAERLKALRQKAD